MDLVNTCSFRFVSLRDALETKGNIYILVAESLMLSEYGKSCPVCDMHKSVTKKYYCEF